MIRRDKDRKKEKMEVDSMSAVVGVTPNSLGSAYIETPHAKVTAAIFGPRQFPIGEVRNEARFNVRAVVEGAAATTGGSVSDRERSLCAQVVQSLEAITLLPRMGQFLYDVVIQCHFGGDVCAETDAAITAASLACADAGIEIKDILCCTTVTGPEPLVCPATMHSLRSAGARLRVASGTSAEGGIVHMSLSGVMGDRRKLEEAMSLCTEVNRKRRHMLIEALTRVA